MSSPIYQTKQQRELERLDPKNRFRLSDSLVFKVVVIVSIIVLSFEF